MLSFNISCVCMHITKIGISIGWWKHVHNVHHIRTNDIQFDPDIQFLPIFAVTNKYLNNVYSKFHDKLMKYDNIAKIFVKYQHILFIPICLSGRINLHIQSYIYLLFTTNKNPTQKLPFGKYNNIIELVTLSAYFVWLLPLIYNTNYPILYYFISYITAGMCQKQSDNIYLSFVRVH